MQWGVWIGLGWSALVVLITMAIQYGYNKKQFESIFKMLDEHDDRLKEQRRGLSSHSVDMDMHWTSRERDSQARQLDRIEELLQDALADRAGVKAEIADLKKYLMTDSSGDKDSNI